MQINKTNKAKIKIQKNKVEKIYYDQERAKTEYNNYKKLHSIMKDTEHKKWSFKSPRIYCLNGNKLTMEKAKGLSLSDLINEGKPEAAYYAGIYLGLFHKNSCQAEPEKCISYGDYNRTNVFLDFDNKTIWGIDPGDRFGRLLLPENDIAGMFFSIAIEEIRNLNFRFKHSVQFFKGYNTSSFRDIRKLTSVKSLIQKITRAASKNYSGIKAVFVTLILNLILIPVLILNFPNVNNKNNEI